METGTRKTQVIQLQINNLHSTALRNHMRIFFSGDVVLDTYNNVSRDEDNILNQVYIKQICPDFYHDDF